MRIPSSVVRYVIPAIIAYIAASIVAALTLGPRIGSIVMVFGSIAMYVAIAWATRAITAEAFYVAERRIPPIVNGAATAADWMSGASFISMAGAIAILGYDAMPYIIGWTLGYVLHAFLIAPYIRKSETFTIPELVEARAGGWPVARLIAVIMLFVVSFTYLTAQLLAVGVIIGRFLEISVAIGIFIGVVVGAIYALTGGWKSITWTQFAQYIVLIVMYWLPVILVSAIIGLFKPFPHLAYGEVLDQIVSRESQFGLAAFTEPFARKFGGGTGQLNWILSALLLMLGTIGLPHILIRSYTVPSAHGARVSVGWALLFIGLLYVTAPIYASLARLSFSELWGKPIEEVMSSPWVQKWLPTGLVKIVDLNGDGILQPGELSFHKDIVVVGMPDMWGLSWVIAPLVAVGGLAAAMSTADGLLLSMTTGLSRDVYRRFINPKVPEEREIFLIRALVLVLAFLAGLAAYGALKIPGFALYVALLVGWAFVFAASSFTPAIILGIFWKRLNRYGMVAGMIAGMATALPYVLLVGTGYMNPVTIAGQQIGTVAWGVVSFFVNLVVSIVVSLLTRPEGPDVEKFVDKMRLPELYSRG